MMKLSPNYQQLSEDLFLLIKTNQYEIALKIMNHWPIENDKVLRRMKWHMLGKIELVKGQYEKAISIFNTAIEEEGCHLLLYADVVAAHYLAQKYSTWILATAELAKLIKQLKHKVNRIVFLRSAIVLAKSLELQGQIDESYKLFLEISKDSQLEFALKAICSLVRIESLFPQTKGFLDHFMLLKQFNLGKEYKDFDFDIFHSLILAESKSFSLDHVKNKLDSLPKEPDCYFQLSFFDLLEIIMGKSFDEARNFYSLYPNIKPGSPRDKALHTILFGETTKDWAKYCHQMPLGTYLRIAPLILKTINPEAKNNCHQQTELILKGFSRTSRTIWRAYHNSFIELNSSNYSPLKIELNFKLVDHFLTVGTHKINLGRQKLLIKLFSLLIEVKKMSNHELIHRLWNSEVNHYSLEKLRQLVNRANSITKSYAFIRPLKFSEDSTSLVTVQSD